MVQKNKNHSSLEVGSAMQLNYLNCLFDNMPHFCKQIKILFCGKLCWNLRMANKSEMEQITKLITYIYIIYFALSEKHCE